MDTVGTLITNVSTDLNDQRPGHAFTRWGRGFLLAALNDGLAETSTFRPDAFATKVNLTLVPGNIQDTPQTYRMIRKVIANSDGSPVTEGDISLIRAMAGMCKIPVTFDKKGNPDYKVRSFAVDVVNPKTFYVSPAVPDGLSVIVSAEVVPQAPTYTLQDWNKEVVIDSNYKNSLHDFMMGRANFLNTESAESRGNGIMYMTNFYKAMGVNYKMESAYRSGYYLGQVGAGDPAARAQ